MADSELTDILYRLQPLGYVIPPQSPARWIGDIGPGFTNRNTPLMTWNLMYLTRMIERAPGVPASDRSRGEWGKRERFGFVRAT